MNENVIECVQLAAECLPGLAYNLYLPFIDEVIEMCSNTWVHFQLYIVLFPFDRGPFLSSHLCRDFSQLREEDLAK